MAHGFGKRGEVVRVCARMPRADEFLRVVRKRADEHNLVDVR